MENQRSKSVLLDLATGRTETEELPSGSNYAIIDASGIREIAALAALSRLQVDLCETLLSGAEQVTVLSGPLDRLQPPILFGQRGIEGAVTLALPCASDVGRDLWDELVRLVVELLRDIFSRRPNGARQVWYGPDEFTVYEDPEHALGVTTIEVHGPRHLADPAPASGPSCFPQSALRAAIEGSTYGCVVTPDEEPRLPLAHIISQVDSRAVGIHADPRSVGRWLDFLRATCAAGALVETYGAGKDEADPAALSGACTPDIRSALNEWEESHRQLDPRWPLKRQRLGQLLKARARDGGRRPLSTDEALAWAGDALVRTNSELRIDR